METLKRISILLLLLCPVLYVLGKGFSQTQAFRGASVPVITTTSGPVAFESSLATNRSGSGTFTFPFTVASIANGYLILHVAVNAATVPAINTPTYNGVAMTQIAFTNMADILDFQHFVYGLAAPASGTHDIVLTYTGDTVNGDVGVTLWSGVNQSTPTSAVTMKTSSGAKFSPTSISVASATGEIVVSSVFIYGTEPTPSAPQTITLATNISSTVYLSVARTNGAALVTSEFTYDASSRYWSAVAVSLKP